MKLILFILTFLPAFTFSQCFTFPCSSYQSIPASFTNFSGNKCIEGDGTLNGTFSNFQHLSFKGNMLVNSTIVMGNKKIYSAININISQVAMLGNDTIFVSGELNIYELSGIGQNNVIKLSAGTNSIMIGSATYFPGDVICGNIKIQQCNANALPVIDNSLKVVKDEGDIFHISFKSSLSNSSVKHFNIWVKEGDKRVLIKSASPAGDIQKVDVKLSEIEAAFNRKN